MRDRLARAYIILLAAIGIGVLALTFFLHLRALLRNSAEHVSLGHLFTLNWIVAVALLGLAKERNVWANEMRNLPRWIPKALVATFVYTLAVWASTVMNSAPTTPASDLLAMSAFLCPFMFGCVCIPFALLQAGYLDADGLRQRARASMLTLLVASTLLGFMFLFPSKKLHNA